MQIYQNQCAAGARKHYYFFGQHQIKDDVYYQIITQVQQVPFPFSTSGIFLPVTVLKTVARMIGHQPATRYYICAVTERTRKRGQGTGYVSHYIGCQC